MKKKRVIFFVGVFSVVLIGLFTLYSERPGKSGIDDKFITYNPLDLSQFYEISTFRSCAGHDYSGYDVEGVLEGDRSMKHYIAPRRELIGSINVIEVRAPFDGRIEEIRSEQVAIGEQVWLVADEGGGWDLVLFYVTLIPSLKRGSKFKAGEVIAYVNLPEGMHDFDMALVKRGWHVMFDSVFTHMTDEVLFQYVQRGVTLDKIIIDKNWRDKHPCECHSTGEEKCRFSSSGDEGDSWVRME